MTIVEGITELKPGSIPGLQLVVRRRGGGSVEPTAKVYAERAGFTVDNDVTVREGLRFIQLTPPGSGCSVSIGEGITEMKPGSLQGLQLVVDDVEAARDELGGALDCHAAST